MKANDTREIVKVTASRQAGSTVGELKPKITGTLAMISDEVAAAAELLRDELEEISEQFARSECLERLAASRLTEDERDASFGTVRGFLAQAMDTVSIVRAAADEASGMLEALECQLGGLESRLEDALEEARA
jgi:hypothetical protein